MKLHNELLGFLLDHYDSDRFHLQKYGNWFLAPKAFPGWTVDSAPEHHFAQLN